MVSSPPSSFFIGVAGEGKRAFMPSADGWAEPPTVGERYRKERRRRGLIRVIIVAVGPIDEPTSDGDGKERKKLVSPPVWI